MDVYMKLKLLIVLSFSTEALLEQFHENTINDIYYILHGDLSKIDERDITDEPSDRTLPPISDEPELVEIEELFFKDTNKNHSLDTAEFDGISRALANNTRRSRYLYFHGWHDIEDEKFPSGIIEVRKRKMFEDMCLQWLIHARYKIYAALKQREIVRGDKRYRLGYLFNRLRRIHYDQNKLVDSLISQNYKYYTLDLISLMRTLQRVKRLDVDVKDTINLIKSVYSEPDPMELAEKAKKTKKN